MFDQHQSNVHRALSAPTGMQLPLKLAAVLLLALLLTACATPRAHPEPPVPLPQPQIQEPPRQNNGAIFQSGYDVRLYEDRTARRVGDIVTVIFEEQTNARKDASAAASKGSEASLGVPTVFGRPMTVRGNPISASGSADRSFSGSGEADQSNQLRGTLTATVVSVQPNGNLVLQGQKKITLNRGDEYVTVTGVVRRDDVRPDNTISSTRVANAQISYTGTGALADASQMGWLQRIFFSVWMPM
jgi:flagellar L-ring protein FlgH